MVWNIDTRLGRLAGCVVYQCDCISRKLAQFLLAVICGWHTGVHEYLYRYCRAITKVTSVITWRKFLSTTHMGVSIYSSYYMAWWYARRHGSIFIDPVAWRLCIFVLGWIICIISTIVGLRFDAWIIAVHTMFRVASENNRIPGNGSWNCVFHTQSSAERDIYI